jgi:hypothetical protein
LENLKDASGIALFLYYTHTHTLTHTHTHTYTNRNALTLTQLSNPETSKSVEEEKSVIALRVKCILLLSFDDLSVLKY